MHFSSLEVKGLTELQYWQPSPVLGRNRTNLPLYLRKFEKSILPTLVEESISKGVRIARIIIFHLCIFTLSGYSEQPSRREELKRES